MFFNKDECQSLANQDTYSFEDLCRITEILRSPGGCPWDVEQTHESIRRCMIEEAYEVVEAIDNHDQVLLTEELGDVLFQVIFHAQIEKENQCFSINDVIDGICKKMIHRHPHVFANGTALNGEDALKQWNTIKKEEKNRKTLSSRLRAIPPILPALLRAQKVCEKMDTANSGQTGLLDTLKENYDLFDQKRDSETLGNLLLSISKISAEEGLDAELALNHEVENLIQSVENSEKSKIF